MAALKVQIDASEAARQTELTALTQLLEAARTDGAVLRASLAEVRARRGARDDAHAPAHPRRSFTPPSSALALPSSAVTLPSSPQPAL
eukprot:1076656-Prymnesium_polylepis.1